MSRTKMVCVFFVTPMNRSPRGSSVHGILQARTLEWAAISSSRGSSQPRDQTYISWVFCITTSTSWEAMWCVFYQNKKNFFNDEQYSENRGDSVTTSKTSSQGSTSWETCFSKDHKRELLQRHQLYGYPVRTMKAEIRIKLKHHSLNLE